MGYVRELNEGVPRIYSSMQKSMLAKPEYSIVNNTVKLLLRNKISNHDYVISDRVMKLIESVWSEFNDTQKSMIFYMFERNHATLDEFVAFLNISTTAVRGYLSKLCGQNIFEKNSQKIRDINAVYTFKKSLVRIKKS
jgi:ATP-dependent DNA helicase RecG